MADAARQLEAADGWRVRRQRFSVERKRLIVEATLEPGASVAQVARAHEINANQVFKWKRLYERGLLVSRPTPDRRLLAVHVAEEPSSELARMPTAESVATGAIHVEIPARAPVLPHREGWQAAPAESKSAIQFRKRPELSGICQYHADTPLVRCCAKACSFIPRCS